MHRVLAPILGLTPGSTLILDDDEAVHALRVKRVRPGEAIQILDGQGLVADATVLDPPCSPRTKRGELHLRLSTIRPVEPVRPEIRVLSATPKGPRVDDLVQQLAQIGAASWGPLSTERGVVDPRETKLARLERLAAEASKQCGRAWSLRLDPPTSFADAITPEQGTLIVLADASGDPPRPVSSPRIRFLIGPEGGFTPAELAAARQNGGAILNLGPHIMRIETAAPVGAAILLACSTWNTHPPTPPAPPPP